MMYLQAIFHDVFDSIAETDRHLNNVKDKVVLTDLHGLIFCLKRLMKYRD